MRCWALHIQRCAYTLMLMQTCLRKVWVCHDLLSESTLALAVGKATCRQGGVAITLSMGCGGFACSSEMFMSNPDDHLPE